jgi:putative FmdB family regulatory protein
MPLYEYRCKNCNISIEKLESFTSPEVQNCESCGESDSLQRQISKTSFAMSGGGWFKDSYQK